jgi:hypothetical protein
MGYARLVKSVDYDQLTEQQRSTLRDLLKKRKTELQKAMDDVEEGLDRLKPKSKTKKRKR